MFKLGWKKDPKDERDIASVRRFKVTGKKLPSNFELPYQIPVYDQGNIGSCVANSGCAAYLYELLENGKGVNDLKLSRLFAYYNIRKMNGWEDEDSGAYIRDVFKSFNKDGVSEEKFWPYLEHKFTTVPPVESYENAKLHKAIKYARVEQTKSAIQQTLYSGATVSFGFSVYENFVYGTWDKTTGKMPKPKGEHLGGHAVTLIGWHSRKKCFLIQNSWGEDWGLKGKFWMPYIYVLDPSISDDFWCIEESTL